MIKLTSKRFSVFFKFNALKMENFNVVNDVLIYDKHKDLSTNKRSLKAQIFKEKAIFKKLMDQIDKKTIKNLIEKSDNRRDTRESSESEKIGEYSYFTRSAFHKEKEYSVIYRHKTGLEKEEEVVFNPINEGFLKASELKTFLCTKLVLSDCQNLLGVVVDSQNNEHTKAYLKNLKCGKMLGGNIASCSNLIFGHKNKFVYYVRLDSKNRPFEIFRRNLGEINLINDVKIFEEIDPKYFLDLSLSKCKQYVFLLATCNNLSKIYVLKNTGEIGEQFTLLSTEESGFSSVQSTNKGVFFVQFKNGQTRILGCSISNFEKGVQENQKNAGQKKNFENQFKSQQILLMDSHETLTEVDVFENEIILYVNSGLQAKLYLIKIGNEISSFSTSEIKFRDNQFGMIYPSSNVSLSPQTAQFSFDSPFVYNENYELDLPSKTIQKSKEYKMTGQSFRPNDFTATKLVCPSREGIEIPVWCLHAKNKPLHLMKNPQKLLVKSYGCYGIPSENGFSVTDLNYLEDDWTVLIPMIRGGGDLGLDWHSSATLENKYRSVQDLEDVLCDVINRGITHPSLVCLKSNSAGATIVAALVNKSPHLIKSAILAAPFLDIYSLLVDDTLPLAQSDYAEFGNPKMSGQLNAILALCPYSNIKPQEYPVMLLNCYEDDYRTPLWQAVKWVKKTREHAFLPVRVKEIEGRNIFLNVLKGSHNGPSSGNESIEQGCLELAFLNHVIETSSLDVSVQK